MFLAFVVYVLIDILVELDYTKPIGLEYIKIQLELEELSYKKVDLISSKGMSKHIQLFINQHKILIYDKYIEKSSYEDFQSNSMMQITTGK